MSTPLKHADEDQEEAAGEELQEQVGEMEADVAAEQQGRKTGNDGAERNLRAQKRARGDDGAPVDGTALKECAQINLDDLIEVKHQYDVYTEVIERSEVPFYRMKPEFQRTFMLLTDRLEAQKRGAREHTTLLEEKKYLAPQVARQMHCALDDNNINAVAQHSAVTFVAANRDLYLATEQRAQQSEERAKQLESQLLQLQGSTAGSAVAKPRAVTTPRAAAPKKPLAQESTTSSTTTTTTKTTRLPAVYDRWHEGAVPEPRFDAGESRLASVFNSFFDNKFVEQ